MNILSNLILGTENNANKTKSLIQIKKGTLTVNKKIILKAASLLIKTTKVKFNYELICEAPDELEEYACLIGREIKFHVKGQKLCWSDRQGGNCEFESNSEVENVGKFYETVLECMYERHFSKSAKEFATEEDLELFKYSPTAVQTEDDSADLLTTRFNNSLTFDESSTLIKEKGDLFQYDLRTAEFKAVGTGVYILIKKSLKKDFNFNLEVEQKSITKLCQPIDSGTSPLFRRDFGSFIWVFSDENNFNQVTLSVRFSDKEGEERFRTVFMKCYYEATSKEKFDKLEVVDQNMIRDICMEDTLSTENEEEDEFYTDNDEESVENDSESNYTEKAVTFNTPSKVSEKNSLLAIGYNQERSFVVRGNQLGVFSHDLDDVRYNTAISLSSKNPITPSKVMLHEQDSALIMMDKSQSTKKLMKMDIEYGKVVEEWNVDDDRDLVDFLPGSKYEQMTGEKTFVGFSNNALFKIDPRQPGNKLVSDKLNQYKGKYDFKCATTTGDGDLVVASGTGDLRLYNQLEKRAKTHLPGMGDGAIGIDVTEDGRYILSTFTNYLLLVDTVSPSGVSGFDKSLGKEKPVPKRLQLKPEHAAVLGRICFTPARFNIGKNDPEKKIVTSTGQFVITWNFRRVKMGHLHDYVIKQYPEKVIAESFRYQNDSRVIVTLPDDVTMSATKQFDSPKKLLETPVKSLRKKTGGVVDSPY